MKSWIIWLHLYQKSRRVFDGSTLNCRVHWHEPRSAASQGFPSSSPIQCGLEWVDSCRVRTHNDLRGCHQIALWPRWKEVWIRQISGAPSTASQGMRGHRGPSRKGSSWWGTVSRRSSGTGCGATWLLPQTTWPRRSTTEQHAQTGEPFGGEHAFFPIDYTNTRGSTRICTRNRHKNETKLTPNSEGSGFGQLKSSKVSLQPCPGYEYPLVVYSGPTHPPQFTGSEDCQVPQIPIFQLSPDLIPANNMFDIAGYPQKSRLSGNRIHEYTNCVHAHAQYKG